MKNLISKNLVWVFSLTFLATIALTGCGKGCGKKEGAGKVEADIFELIPVNSNVLLGMNWEKLQSSPLGDKMKKEIPADVAPMLKNIKGITIGLNAQAMGQDPDFLAIISGSLDPAAVLAQVNEEAKKKGVAVTEEEYQGIKIHSLPKDENLGLAFLEGKGLVGQKSMVKQAIDLSKKQGESVQKNEALMNLVKGVDKSKMLWAVGVVPPNAMPAAGGPGGAGNPLGALSGVEALDLAVDFGNELTVDLGIISGAEEDAKKMETMANSYKTLFGGSLAEKDPALGKILNGLAIGVNGKKLEISLKVDKATVEELSNKAASQGGPGGSPGMMPEPEGKGEAPAAMPMGEES